MQAMPDVPVLQITSLPAIHPYGRGLLDRFGLPMAYRLGTLPTRVEGGKAERSVRVDWLASPGEGPAVEVDRVIGWRDIPDVDLVCSQLRHVVNANHLTEFAACGVMCLLLHNLEGDGILDLLEIGEGADYLTFRDRTGNTAVEVSGIYEVEYASQSRSRLVSKREQLLAAFSAGYVSVSTFSHPPGGCVHSYLHFAVRPGTRGEKTMQGNVTLTTVDPRSEAGLAAAAGQAALMVGDMKIANKKYLEAGSILEGRTTGAAQADKHLLRFLAASQYYHGGDYRKAASLAERVEEGKLPPEVRPLFPKFFRAAKERAAPGYAQGVRDRLQAHWRRGEYRVVMEGLQQHPYILERSVLAFLRSFMCQYLGDYRAAAAFFVSAHRFGVTAPEHVMGLAVVPVDVYREHGPEAGWESARLVAEVFPHASTATIASLVAHHRALQSGGPEQQEWRRRQLDFFQRAWKEFPHLPQEYHRDWEFRELLAIIAVAAAGAAFRLGDRIAADAALKAAEGLSPRTQEVLGLIHEYRRRVADEAEAMSSPPDLQNEDLVWRVVRRGRDRASQALAMAGV
jgi:hypothetical protein